MTRASTCSILTLVLTLLGFVAIGFVLSRADEATNSVVTAPSVPSPITNKPTVLLDNLVLGDDVSENQHKLSAEKSEIGKGALDQPTRKLLPGGDPPWEGGKFSFIMAVDPQAQNYFTARFWGDDIDENYMILFCEGKQVGYRHLGDIDVLALPAEAPVYPGRFFYVTTPLPLSMTQGKSEVSLEIRATGPIWGYASTFDKYQKPMTKPTRPIYRLYTHTDGCFTPPADEPQGAAPVPTKRTAPGPEVVNKVKQQLNDMMTGMLSSTKPLNQMQLQFLAKAYFMKWTTAYQSPAALQQIVAGVDQLYKRWQENPNELWQDKATWNPGWFGVGPAGDAVRLMKQPLQASLDQKMDDGTVRRTAWSQLFQAGRDYLRHNRRWLSNQAMFSDTNLYLCNRAVDAIDPPNALPEVKALDYLYQADGIVPWLGSDTDAGPQKIFGSDFYEVTQKGLTRERGYVGGYGEGGLEGATDMYLATCDPGGGGDPKLKTQLAKMLRARAAFRYPLQDAEGHTAMRLETIVGWRDTHVPGDVTYAQRSGGSHSALEATAATLDPAAIGYVQQMMDDNQLYASIADHAKDTRFRAKVGLLPLPEQLALLKAQPASPHRLPMGWDQPDYVFADEEDGVVAIKHDHEILYASLYWRAGYAINFLARTHYLTPNYQQVAVVHEDAKFDPSAETYTRPDWINFGFGNGGGAKIAYPSDLHQALAGEELPIHKIPADVTFTPGTESHFSGRADFYTLKYGPYLIGMNTTTDKTFAIDVPKDARSIKELVSGRTDVVAGSQEKVGPLSTVVYYLRGAPQP
jgi:hypothetical protein